MISSTSSLLLVRKFSSFFHWKRKNNLYFSISVFQSNKHLCHDVQCHCLLVWRRQNFSLQCDPIEISNPFEVGVLIQTIEFHRNLLATISNRSYSRILSFTFMWKVFQYTKRETKTFWQWNFCFRTRIEISNMWRHQCVSFNLTKATIYR